MSLSSSDSQQPRFPGWASALVTISLVAVSIANVYLVFNQQKVELRLENTQERLDECRQEQQTQAEEVGKRQERNEELGRERGECEAKLRLCQQGLASGDTDVDDDQ